MNDATKQSKRIYLTVGFLLCFVAMIVGIFVAEHSQTKKKPIDVSQFSGTLLQTPREVAPFELTGTVTENFTNEALQGQWTFMFFGFTNCPKLCPTTMAELAKMYRILEKDKIKTMPKVLMISIDPDRDDLEKMKSYVTAFNQHFIGAIGSEDKVDTLTKQMGIVHMKVAGQGDTEDYDIQHSGTVMLFNPQGKITAFFSYPHDAKAVAHDYELLVA